MGTGSPKLELLQWSRHCSHGSPPLVGEQTVTRATALCSSCSTSGRRLLTFQVDEEGSVAKESIRGQVNRELTGQVHPGDHHQLNQLGGRGGGFPLKTLGGIESRVSQFPG